MNRRNFLYSLGFCLTALAGGISIFPPPATLKRVPLSKSDTNSLPAELAQLLYLATLAPSSHNTQPWQIELASPQRWLLSLNSARCLPVVDPQHREMILSLGTFLENLHQASAASSWEMTYHVLQPDPLAPLIEIVLQPKPAPRDNNIIIQMESRRTLRRSLLTTTLKKEDVELLVAADPLLAYYSQDSSEGKLLSTLTQQSNLRQLASRPIQEELVQWIRLTTAEILAEENGITPASMEMNLFLRWYAEYRLTKKDLLSDFSMKESLRLTEQQLTEGSGWIICMSPNGEVASLLSAGRRFEALWLRATAKKIAVHPMSQALEDPLCQAELTHTLGKTPIQFIARIGYCSDYPAPVSPRMSLTKLIGKGVF